jgi:hypothetical protein
MKEFLKENIIFMFFIVTSAIDIYCIVTWPRIHLGSVVSLCYKVEDQSIQCWPNSIQGEK